MPPTSIHNPEVDWTAAQSLTALSHADLAYEETLSNLANLLDERHGVSYGKEGWRIALGAWLLHLVHPITAYLNDSAPLAPSEGELTFPSFDQSTFLSQLVNATESQATFRFLVVALREDCRKTRVAEKYMRSRVSGGLTEINKPDYNRVNMRAIYIPTYAHKAIDESRSLNEVSSRWSLSGPPVQTSFEIDRRWRLRALEHPQEPSLSSVCLAMARLYLPVTFLEAFPVIRKGLIGNGGGVFYTANAVYSDTAFALHLAEHRANSLLLHHQHGGGYGIDEKHSLETFERRISKTYFTWGWSEQGQERSLKPLSIPPRLFVSKEKLVKECLLICVGFPKFVYRLHNHPTANRACSLVDDTLQFVKSMDSDVNLCIRPYHQDYGDDFYNRLPDEAANSVEKGDAARLWREQSTCIYPLVVANYLGTSWLETLAANIPTVCFYDPEAYAFRKDAMPLIDELLNAEILHPSPESAAEHVNRIHNDPGKWWQRSEIQDLRERFCLRYARMSENWASDWTRAFDEELASSA